MGTHTDLNRSQSDVCGGNTAAAAAAASVSVNTEYSHHQL